MTVSLFFRISGSCVRSSLPDSERGMDGANLRGFLHCSPCALIFPKGLISGPWQPLPSSLQHIWDVFLLSVTPGFLNGVVLDGVPFSIFRPLFCCAYLCVSINSFVSLCVTLCMCVFVSGLSSVAIPVRLRTQRMGFCDKMKTPDVYSLLPSAWKKTIVPVLGHPANP